jgi:hypothetical protein
MFRHRARHLDTDEADSDDMVAEAADRLGAAGLIPPINGLELVEYVRVTTEQLTPEMAARITEALDGLPHKVEQVPPGHGILYRRL